MPGEDVSDPSCRPLSSALAMASARIFGAFTGMQARGLALAAPVLALTDVKIGTAMVTALGTDLASIAPWGLPLGMAGARARKKRAFRDRSW